ncbi:MAG: 3-keto-5-aminohexanoate cleavage protein [Pseudomonadota bacterium]
MVVCITTGGSLTMPIQERLRVIPMLQPELASLNCGSMNFALHPILEKYKEFKFEWEKNYLSGTEDLIFPNTFKSLGEFAKAFEEYRVQPELEIYDVGMINNAAFMFQRGQLKKPVYMQFVMGILGGIPATADNLLFLRNSAKAAFGDITWSVCAAGRFQFEMCALSLLLGGNARVGLEDNLYLEKGVHAKSNAEQVAKIVRIAREFGIEPASPDEAREILQLKGLDKVAY